jgi:hypothetical protein
MGPSGGNRTVPAAWRRIDACPLRRAADSAANVRA